MENEQRQQQRQPQVLRLAADKSVSSFALDDRVLVGWGEQARAKGTCDSKGKDNDKSWLGEFYIPTHRKLRDGWGTL